MNLEKKDLIFFILFLILFYKVFFVSENMAFIRTHPTEIEAAVNKRYHADVDAIRNLSSLANDLTKNGKLVVKGGLEIEGPLTVSQKITTKGGGDFSGGKYHFTDSEKCGKLRVGCAWGVPGIYAEDGKNLILGSSKGEVQFQNNSSRIIGKNGQFSNVMSTSERNNYMRTSERGNYMTTSERDDYNRKDQYCLDTKWKGKSGKLCIYETGYEIYTTNGKTKWRSQK